MKSTRRSAMISPGGVGNAIVKFFISLYISYINNFKEYFKIEFNEVYKEIVDNTPADMTGIFYKNKLFTNNHINKINQMYNYITKYIFKKFDYMKIDYVYIMAFMNYCDSIMKYNNVRNCGKFVEIMRELIKIERIKNVIEYQIEKSIMKIDMNKNFEDIYNDVLDIMSAMKTYYNCYSHNENMSIDIDFDTFYSEILSECCYDKLIEITNKCTENMYDRMNGVNIIANRNDGYYELSKIYSHIYTRIDHPDFYDNENYDDENEDNNTTIYFGIFFITCHNIGDFYNFDMSELHDDMKSDDTDIYDYQYEDCDNEKDNEILDENP